MVLIEPLCRFSSVVEQKHGKLQRTVQFCQSAPFSLNIFKSSDGYPIRVNPKFRTNEQTRKYFDKLDKYMKSKISCKLNYYDTIFDCNIMDETYPATNNEAVIRVILIEDKKLIRENKLRLGIITLDVSEIKKICTPKVYDFIMSACEEYKKDFKNFISRISI